MTPYQIPWELFLPTANLFPLYRHLSDLVLTSPPRVSPWWVERIVRIDGTPVWIDDFDVWHEYDVIREHIQMVQYYPPRAEKKKGIK